MDDKTMFGYFVATLLAFIIPLILVYVFKIVDFY